MANNIIPGKNIGLGLQNIALDDIAALTTSSVLIVKQYVNGVTKTWKKNRPINSLTSITIDAQIDIRAITDIDLTGIIGVHAVDFVASTAETVIGDSDGTVIVDSDGNAIKIV